MSLLTRERDETDADSEASMLAPYCRLIHPRGVISEIFGKLGATPHPTNQVHAEIYRGPYFSDLTFKPPECNHNFFESASC